MIPINNSDTAWLIVADYNQENNLYHEELREDIYNPNINHWHHDYNLNYNGDLELRTNHNNDTFVIKLAVGTDIGYNGPGSGMGSNLVGGNGPIFVGLLVGGHIHDPN